MTIKTDNVHFCGALILFYIGVTSSYRH